MTNTDTEVDKSVITQDVINLYHDFTHGDGNRRKFMKNLSLMVGGMVTANSILPMLENKAEAQQIAPDDDRLNTLDVTLKVGDKEVYAYGVYPKGVEGKMPGVVVIHENRGLNGHIMDVARRVALEGYLVLAPDAVSLLGRRAKDDDEGREMIGQLDAEEARQVYLAAIDHLNGLDRSTGKVGTVGFCWGGSMSGRMAVGSDNLSAAVVYYGGRPSAEDVPKIKVPMMMHYAEMDSRQMAFIPQYRADLEAARKEYDLKIWWDAQHAFNNDSNEARYDEKSAKEAWAQTMLFFEQKLK
ncbi:MAG: dienelactone hydrolase family protein [Kordiimonadaceae bacterium]|jgi:carboxymethylenebutenolidase|nr:dienelactone hydrolase family protein [Kordiimonadaceae bacterium]MBT6035589.1 dienelactone hydrolase family protein [Kordiimonadaceae bacterium]MBT6328458.1 dienelactone hydrolase family protein [Kordiimonadaceae bacterium]